MRFILVLAFITPLILAASCANSDDITANWVLQTVTGNTKPKFSLTPTVGQFARPETTTERNVATPNFDVSPSTEGQFARPESTTGKNTATTKFDLSPNILDTSVDCTTRDNYQGVCVTYYQCNSNTKRVIEDGAGLIDVRTNACPHYLQVCCRKNDIQSIESLKTDDSENNDAGSSNRNKDTGDISTAAVKPGPVSSSINITECGWSNPGVSPFIFRDTDAGRSDPTALFGDFPWMVALLQKSGDSVVWSRSDYLGGGTLIHPSVVMTVAHKLATRKKNYSPNELKCRAGEWDTQTDSELYQHQERDIAKFIVHENYNRVSVLNDIALLILERPFNLKNAPHMGIGCIAPSSPPPNALCYSMGWGRDDRVNKKHYANILKKVLLHVIEHDKCQKMLRDNSRLGPLFQVHESLMCASGDEGVDTCRGDGGSPLVCAVSDLASTELRYAVYGMVAYGTDCFNPNVPGMYANMALLKGWVDGKMQEEGLDTKYYTL